MRTGEGGKYRVKRRGVPPCNRREVNWTFSAVHNRDTNTSQGNLHNYLQNGVGRRCHKKNIEVHRMIFNMFSPSFPKR